MLEHPFSTARVELPRLEREVLRVRDLKGGAGHVAVTVRGFRDHRLRVVHADRPTRRVDDRSDRSDVVSCPTADVEHPVAACDLELLEDPPLHLGDRPDLPTGIQKLDQILRRSSRIAAEALPNPGARHRAGETTCRAATFGAGFRPPPAGGVSWR